MHKIMVELYLPAAGKCYDIKIPAFCRIGELIPLLETGMAELEPGYFIPNGNSVLCERETGVILNLNLTVEETGILNGTRLMLI